MSGLVVGGPYNGRRYGSSKSSFRVPILERNSAVPAEQWQPNQVSLMTYVQQTLFGQHWVWVPEGQTLKETTELLLKGYHPEWYVL